MKATLIVPAIFFAFNLFHDFGNACNSHYGGGYGLFGDDYVHGGNPYVHMNVHGHHHHHGHGYHNHGGLMDSLLRTDIGSGSHHHHHSHRHHLIPVSHHRHVHRIHRRSTHSRRSRTMLT